ncbi:hypothetical protein [Candidatus Venteria ishoeyi]|uniref:Uncharacterized protein n=1 Tax=Candidatus Venteria ishoeyi TaxID=1899563 RepID=A0A1H6F790_9GAMM|nr:hypothetical protein [Candidatus Venteria ishoeyi]MDM8546083.1 hypothetical protein [Candidatus Venteria ishoeyi]SEH05992.1 Uncharacterised protein [Candidatus Venteria ishoeyi]
MAFLGLEWVTLPFATDSIKKLLQQWREIRVRRKLEIDALAVARIWKRQNWRG